MTPSTSVTNSRSYGSLLFSLRSARSDLFLIDERYAAADQSARRAGFHDLSVIIGVAPYSGAKERSGSWIQRSPTRTQRESPNAKFLCQWHERVVLCVGLLKCITPTRLTINPTTYISRCNETRLIKTSSFTYPPFRFLSFFPCPKQANPNAIETGQRIIPTVDQPILTLAHKSFLADPFQVTAKSSSLPGRMHRWFDSTPTSSFFRVSFLPISGRSCCNI